MSQPLADQGDETIGTFAEVNRGGGDQHPHAARYRNHVAASRVRSTVRKVAASLPDTIRRVAAPITISITVDRLAHAGAIGASADDDAASTSTGANADVPSQVSASLCYRASRRHPNSCCGVSPCRRATALTVSPLP